MEVLEVLFVFAILILVFGPTKLPEIARDLGNAINEFRKASSGFGELASNGKGDGEKEFVTEIAEKLQVNTEGKNIKQIAEEVLAKINEDGK